MSEPNNISEPCESNTSDLRESELEQAAGGGAFISTVAETTIVKTIEPIDTCFPTDPPWETI